MHEPTATGGGVRHSTESMFTYHSGAFVGSPAKAATSATGRRITVSLSTSTFPAIAHLQTRIVARDGRVGDLERYPEHLPDQVPGLRLPQDDPVGVRHA